MARLEFTSEEMLRFVRWTLAVHAHLPKKYHAQMDRLLNAHREVLYTQQITLPASQLALHWQCAVADLPTLLYRMTRGNKSAVTYRIEPGTPGLGFTVQLRFAVQEGGTHDTSSQSE